MFVRVLLLFLLAMLVLRAAGRFIGGISQGARQDDRRSPGASPVKMVKDPVCGTFVVPGKALSATADGATLWFCSERCRDAFAAKS
jgi:YHS domain-containing protein